MVSTIVPYLNATLKVWFVVWFCLFVWKYLNMEYILKMCTTSVRLRNSWMFHSHRGSVYINCLYQLMVCLLLRKLGFCEMFSREFIVTYPGMSLLSFAPKIDITQHYWTELQKIVLY